MCSYESRAEVLRPVGEGLNDSEIARRTACRGRLWEFRNWSTDLMEIFGRVCSAVGVEHRTYAQRVWIYRPASVAPIDAYVGRKA